jgi:Xaa-Pro aminopeptidase
MTIDLTDSELALLRRTMNAAERELSEALETGRLDGAASAALNEAWHDARRIRSKLKAADQGVKP